MKLKKLLSFSLLFIALALCVASPIVASGSLKATQGEVLNNQTITEGVHWQKYKATTVNDEGQNGNQVVNMASIAPGAAKVISWAIPDGNGIKPSTLLQAAADFEATYPDYQVIAGINNDYFGSNSSGVFSMRNTSVVDGVVFYAQSQYKQMYGLAIKENNEYKLTPAGGKIEVSENYYLDVYDATGVYVLDTYELSGFNSAPAEGETTVIYEKEITADGFEIFEIATTCNSRVESVYYFEGKYSKTVETSSVENVAVATSNLEIANAIESGSKIRIYKTTGGEYADYDYVLGCPAQTMKDGTILTVDEIKDYGHDHVALRHPRTAIGFKEDGTMVIMVVDGRQAEKGMDGVSERENALLLKNLGCVNSFNFDGGGSSTFAVLINGKLTVTNSPSDGGLRSDANHLLVVVPRVNVEYDVEQEMTADGKVLVKGKANVTCNNGFEYTNATLLVDGVTTGQPADDFEIELNPGEEYHLGLAITYKNGNTSTTKGMGYKAIETIGSKNEEITISNPNVKFSLSATGFTINVDFAEGKEYVTQVKLEYEGKSPVVRKTFTGFMASIVSKVEKDYLFTLTYTYRTSIGETKVVVVENIPYTYGEETGDDLEAIKEAAFNELNEYAAPYMDNEYIGDYIKRLYASLQEEIDALETEEEVETFVAVTKETIDELIDFAENYDTYLNEFKEEMVQSLDDLIKELEIADFGKKLFDDEVNAYKKEIEDAETIEELLTIIENIEMETFVITNPGSDDLAKYKEYVVYEAAKYQYEQLVDETVDAEELQDLNEEFEDLMKTAETKKDIDELAKKYEDNVDNIKEGKEVVSMKPEKEEPKEDPKEETKNNGCAFGASVVSSFILLGALLVLVNKRR